MAKAGQPQENAVDQTARFKMDGKTYEIHEGELTWAEVEDLELYFDDSIAHIDLESGRGTMFLAFLARRRVEPDFTLEQMRNYKVTDVAKDDAERPTEETEGGTAGSPS